MPLRLGPLELTIILLIVVLLFGPGRLGRVAGELGKGIRSFREGLKDKEQEQAGASTESAGEDKPPAAGQ